MIRNKKTLLIAVLGAAAITAPTLGVAQQPQDRGGFFGLTAGQVDYQHACSSVTVACDNSDSAWRFFGGYHFSRNVAMEFGYANLGAASANGTLAGVPVSARYEVFAWDLSGVLSFPVTPQFAFFGKLGVYRADVDSRGNVGAFSGSENDKNGGFTYGVGAQYNFTRALGVRAEYQQYANVGSAATQEDDLGVFTAGIVFRFQ